jgi:hypothetical protein
MINHSHIGLQQINPHQGDQLIISPSPGDFILIPPGYRAGAADVGEMNNFTADALDLGEMRQALEEAERDDPTTI